MLNIRNIKRSVTVSEKKLNLVAIISSDFSITNVQPSIASASATSFYNDNKVTNNNMSVSQFKVFQ